MLKFLLLLTMLFSTLVQAEELPPPATAETINNKIFAVVERYAQSLGCSESVSKQNIHPYQIDNQPTYVALFSADIGCSGGNTVNRSIFVVVKPSAYDRYFVVPQYSGPQQTSTDFPANITGLFIKSGVLWYKALELDPAKDALCCPSIVVSGKVLFQSGRWLPAPPANPQPTTPSPH